jgi:translation initiation factor eIF-2B subunit delta
LPKNVTDENARNWILERFDEFVIKKIIKSEEFIIDAGVQLLKNTKTIMVYSFSGVLMKMLLEAQKAGHKFKVIIVDNPSNHYARSLVSILTSKGIEVIYTLINSVAYFIKDVDKIFVGAYTMFSNGTLMATTGTSIIASCAHQLKIPFYAVCQTYKFSEKNPIDSFNCNQGLSHLVTETGPEEEVLRSVRIPYDLTPSLKISAVRFLGLIGLGVDGTWTDAQ